MNRHSNRPSPGSVNRAPRSRPMRAVMMLSPASDPPAGPGEESSALALLTGILIGDDTWTLAEVRRLISMRETTERGRWRAAGHDEAETSAL